MKNNKTLGFVQMPVIQLNKVEPKHKFVPKTGYTGKKDLSINPDGTISVGKEDWDTDKPNFRGE